MIANITKNQMKIINILLIILLFSSCKKEENNVPYNTNYQKFNYATTKNVNLNIIANNREGAHIIISTTPPKNTGSSIYYSVDTLTHGIISYGSLKTSVQVSSSINNLYIYTTYPGITSVTEITANDNTINIVPTTLSNARLANTSKPSGYIQYGGWNSAGTPDYLTTPINVSNTLLTNINYTLPEAVSIYKPIYPNYNRYNLINQNSIRDVDVVQDGTPVSITYLHLGASFKNSLGFFTYPTGTVPNIHNIINNRTLIFPNCVYSAITPGSTVNLGTFNKGTSIGWFIVSNGFYNSNVDTSRTKFYSIPSFNPENDTSNVHTVMLYDRQNNAYVVGVEDELRTNSDNDFNDVMFQVNINPNAFGSAAKVNPICTPVDSDRDGVPDSFDAYPNDKERAFNNYFPCRNCFGTFAYEDLWPCDGDYDMNDLVLNYNYNVVTSSSNSVADVISTIKIKAIGAGYDNGFGLQFDVAPNQILYRKSSNGNRFTGIVNLSPNGTETDVTDKATIIIFEKAWLFPKHHNGEFYNTVATDVYYNDTLVLYDTISFRKNIYFMNNIGAQPFNPFIFVNGNRSIEVHLPNFKPTRLGNYNLLGTADDASNVATNTYYKSRKNMPFALQFLTDFAYPIEKCNIENAYLKFLPWAESGGSLDTDWYTNAVLGYRNQGNIYNK